MKTPLSAFGVARNSRRRIKSFGKSFVVESCWILRPSAGVVTTRRPFLATNRPSGLLLCPSKLTGSFTIGHGGAFLSLACHFLAVCLSASEDGRKPQPVRSLPLKR